jgi:hypothetical protein
MKVIVNEEDIQFFPENEEDKMLLRNVVNRGLYSLEFERTTKETNCLLIKLAPAYLMSNQT